MRRHQPPPAAGDFTMRISLAAACLATLVLGVSIGCSTTGKATASAATDAASSSSAQGDGIHEYRAVCIQKELHDGNEYVLSTWLDSREAAKAIGDYHGEFKYKGHQIRIEERVKRKKAE